MQGQEPTVFSSLALRSTGSIADVHDALESGDIVRGYPMRGTVFAARAHELQWLTELLANPGPESARARCHAAGITGQHIDRIREIVLAEGPVTNAEFRAIVDRAVDDPDARQYYRIRYLLIVDGSLAYLGPEQKLGPAPDAPGIEEAFNGERQAAADNIIARYVHTHGPVTFEDARWWSKLPVRMLRAAFKHLPDTIVEENGNFMRATLRDELSALSASQLREAHLLPAFDEYILGYQDRLFAMNEETHSLLVPSNMGVFRKAVVVDGTVRGSWRRVNNSLLIDEYTTIPAYAQGTLRRKFKNFPFHPA